MDDLTRRLSSCQAKRGVIVDVVGCFGKADDSLDSLTTVAATATILEGITWIPPTGILQRKSRTATRVVEIKNNRVFAPGLIVPRFYKEVPYENQQLQDVRNRMKKQKVSLGDFAMKTADTFQLELPLTMLKIHDHDTVQWLSSNHQMGENKTVCSNGEETEVRWMGDE
jgi:hypothetical protein